MKNYNSKKSDKLATLKKAMNRFAKLFPDRESQMRALIQISGETGVDSTGSGELSCLNCESKHVDPIEQHRAVKCRRCKKKTWLTAGTFFHGIKQPEAWLAAIWLTEEGYVINSSQLCKLTDISQSSAWELMKKINLAIYEHTIENSEVVSITQFREAISKRNQHSPAGKPPIEELDSMTIDDLNIVETQSLKPEPKIQNVEGRSPEEMIVLNTLGQEPISFDKLYDKLGLKTSELLTALSFLELDNLVKCLPGDFYILTDRTTDAIYPASNPSPVAGSSASDLNPKTKVRVKRIIEFVNYEFTGLSLKYIQLAIAHFSVNENIKKHNHGKLLTLIKNSRKVTRVDIQAFRAKPALLVPLKAS